MKNLIIIFFLLASSNLFAQKSEAYINYIKELKTNTKTDRNDKTVFTLLNNFYDEALQSDEGEMKPETIKKIQDFYANKDAKNKQILNMFLAYQNHISETAAVGKQPNSKFQVDLINDLEQEIKNVYNEVPVIILIYKAEALNSNGQTKESAELIDSSLKTFPNSVPLKVYKYLDTKNDQIKQDLVRNHSNHWMIQQFGIK
ncbi:hypothetical protein EB1_05260 [Empedobacter brevis NBRC 14943 = ATCC 43319]|uniref:Uncharacterized protein n=1 Tax=Empedobacter brevis NBRC 14943 = ATCC 43319 TaxID=1218108 RepID=A0A511NDP6_9FLAO|nr:hypothetical protein [Empedobacter brevis]GEM50736.1 hypothetical protein EB1_05260 [Empedobacter brevis NBRC 14943 = ATCC 43319]